MFCVHRVILLTAVYAFCTLVVLAFLCWHVNMLTSMSDCFCTCASFRMACASLHEACQHKNAKGVRSKVVVHPRIKRARRARRF